MLDICYFEFDELKEDIENGNNDFCENKYLATWAYEDDFSHNHIIENRAKFIELANEYFKENNMPYMMKEMGCGAAMAFPEREKDKWEGYAETEQYDTTRDKNLQIPHENQTDWKEAVKIVVENGCTDSDIEDFVDTHPDVNGKEIWDYVYELDAPDRCKGCEFIQMAGMYPCNVCTRRNQLKDYYKSR